ncbi:hypothetical protein BDW74DRAFT_174895 [Aspergillus multicolor]|uniref:uncharacterized protein n=1 Tax=Aspergillus multicolor TaxID=41759 RepID=UPI003CCD45F3
MPRDDDSISVGQIEDSLAPLTQMNTPSSTVEALFHRGILPTGSSNDDGLPADEGCMMAPPYDDASQWVLPEAESALAGTPVSMSRMPVDDEVLLQNPLSANAFELLRAPIMRPLQSATDFSFAYTTGTSHALGSDDKQAVTFHCKILAPLKSTRNWDRSAHTLFLNKAYKRNMALHFLLAVSHSELAIHFGQGSQPPQESQRHYQRGSQLFLQAHNPFATPDHVSMMLSYLYMYMFWMRREHLDPTKLRDLSRAVLNHVRTYGLDTLCASDDVFSVDGACDSVITVSEQVLLARVITYLYDRDGFCCFFGCGGQFANYMNSVPQKRHRIWLRSRAAFFLPLSEVGHCEAGSEIEDAATIDVYFELIILHQEINNYSQGSVTHATAMKPRLQQRLEAIYKDQATLFHRVTDQPHRFRCTLMAYVTVTVFYALQIYLYRARQCAFATRPIPAEIQDALNSLVSAAYYATKTGQVQLLERFQWSLFIAGLEITDPVHQEWFGKNMSDPAIKKGFDLIQAFKRRSPGSITMEKIRSLVDKG